MTSLSESSYATPAAYRAEGGAPTVAVTLVHAPPLNSHVSLKSIGPALPPNNSTLPSVGSYTRLAYALGLGPTMSNGAQAPPRYIQVSPAVAFPHSAVRLRPPNSTTNPVAAS